ncbi:hypothetical protein [Mycolicibacterium neoaurum]|uniref:hypothetical protein n=1 Tax=Mycolicibacterium neoaurum TaxID=1795 RepID=UPI0004EF76FE|nr:hypothetical protein [Mycolicibacterium neoaurum]AIL29996.1 hypothetical protein D174_25900 [Mycolicibacterium neoaurum VKM Ac-1815D]AMO04046.1 hypothetical protein MyAD_01275 [Mycolicibacterium neoaurum]
MCAAPARHRVTRSDQSNWQARGLLESGDIAGQARHARKVTSAYALHIGRVGALAVSLGVGFAIAGAAQPAYADTGTESPSRSDSGNDSSASDTKNSPATGPESGSGVDSDRDTDSGHTPTGGASAGQAGSGADDGADDDEDDGAIDPGRVDTELDTDEPTEEATGEPTDVIVDPAEPVGDTDTDTDPGRKSRPPVASVEPASVVTTSPGHTDAAAESEESIPESETQESAPAPLEQEPAEQAPGTEVAPAPSVRDSAVSGGTDTPKMYAASAAANESAPVLSPLDVLVNTMMAWVARQISHTFVNRTPVAGPIVYEQNVLGQVYIDLNATDPNGDVLTYDIIQPEKGWVYRDLITGKFVYTPYALVTGQPLVDSFQIVVRDDSEHLPGVLGQIQTLVETVTRFLGIAEADNLTITVPVTVDPVYQAPPLVTPIVGGGYKLGEQPAHIVSTVDIVDGDSTTLKRVVIKIATLAQTGDTLSYTAPTDSPILGTWDPDTLTLTLEGTGTLAEYEAAIKAVTFSATEGALLVRGLTISATDSDDVPNIAPGFVTVAVWPATALPPLVTPIAGGGFTIGGNPSKIVSGVDIVDGDSGKLSKVVVKIATLGQSGDVLGYVAPSGNPVTATWDENTRTLTLVGEGTLAQYEEALKAVTFSATQGAALVRGLTISVTDSDGVENIAPGFVTVNVAAAPTLPPLVTPIAGGGFTIGGNPAKIVSGVDIVDGDSGKLSKVVVKIATLGQSGDVLGYVAPSGNPVTATWDVNTRTLTLVGEGTLAQYEEALKAVTFSATQGAALVRGLTISATDEHGIENIAPGFVTVGVSSPTRLVPLVTPIGGRSYTIGSSPVNPVAAVSIVDADSSHLQQVTVRVTAFGKDGDTLVFAGLPNNPVTASYDAGTRTLTLSGIATKQQYEDALKAVTFSATQGAWTTRTILIVATDTDGVTSAAGSLTLSVW